MSAVGVSGRHAPHDLEHEHGGSLSAEHGVGRSYRDHLAARTGPGRMHAMRLVKAALDPVGLMNPGAVLPD